MDGSGLVIPRGVHARRVFFYVVALTAVTLFVLRYVVLPWLTGDQRPTVSAAFEDTLGNMLATVLATTLIGGLLLYLVPRGRKEPLIEDLPPKEIAPTLERAFPATREWWFSGSVGRYACFKTLPELARLARQANSTRTVVIQVLDPRNDALLTHYANYRRSVRTGQEGDWSVDEVRRDIYATILSAFAWKEAQALLDVRVALKQQSSVFRFDLCDQLLVITREDPKEAGLRCPRESAFYDSFFEEMQYSLRQADLLDMTVPGIRFPETDVPRARELFRRLSLDHAVLSSDSEVDTIVQKAREPQHPYP